MAKMAKIALMQTSSVQEPIQFQQPTYSGDAVLIAYFSDLLQQELYKACDIITLELKNDLSNISKRLDTIENKLDSTISITSLIRTRR